ncbi:dihydropteroate synthase [Zoogloea sp. 1C4]|uniref:dihydropteroate synthase n=1 Tax=Zoogloea sp. 1C4 TaxID=2570190 RepID=UPI001D172F5F|nr:dihydropteroate synthase [Zoogloea sp. 1C4]
MNSPVLQCGRFQLDLTQPKIMAIVNVTTDSFSGDGNPALDAAIRAAERAVEEGAEILDIGGESSRPGATPVPEQQELDRVVPLVEALSGLGVPLSVDTVKPAVMRESIRAGADLINDIAGFRVSGAVDAVRGAPVALCVMHMQGEPGTMQRSPQYTHVVEEVEAFLDERVQVLLGCGVSRDRILLDPGFGFGKTVEHNLMLLRQLERFGAGGYPLLVGMSRKSMLGAITGRDVGERVVAGAAAALVAVQNGARIVRTHDVGATRDVLRLWSALQSD